MAEDQKPLIKEKYVAGLKSSLPDRASVYSWLTEKKPSDEELVGIKTNLNALFPGNRELPDPQLQTIFRLVDGELLRRGL